MVRARRLIPYESEELKAIHLWAENAGIVAASTPKNDTEWEEFEDLYFELKDLIKFLKKIDPNRVVVMSSDEEGNSFSPLFGWDSACHFCPDSGEVVGHEDIKQMNEDDQHEITT